jgi:TRAP-type C4-dicarboxylate transport system permease small subunit
VKKVYWFFNHIEEIISSFIIFVVFILLAYSIIGRLVGLPTSGIQELIQYGFVISILFGISFAAREREHIRADIILEHVSEKTKKVMLLFADMIWLFFSFCIAWFSIPFIQSMIDFPQWTPSLRIPFWILYLMVPISSGLTCIRIIQSNIAGFGNKSESR